MSPRPQDPVPAGPDAADPVGVGPDVADPVAVSPVVAGSVPPGRLRLLALSTATSAFDRFAFAPLLVAVARDLDESLAATTAAASVYFLLYGLGQAVWGVVSDRFGRVRVMRLAMAGAAVGAVLSAAAPNLLLLAGARAMTGAFIGGVTPTALVYVGDAVPLERRQGPLAELLGASAVAIALSTVLSGVAAGAGWWRATLLAPGLVAAALVVGLRALPEPAGDDAGGLSSGQKVGRVLASRPARRVLAVALVEGGLVLGGLTFVPGAVEGTGSSAAVAGAATAAYGVASLVGSRLVRRRRFRRLGAHGFLTVGGGLIAASFLPLAISQRPASAFVATSLLGLGFAAFHTTLQAWATDVVPEARGTAVAMFAASLFVGSAAATALVAPLVNAGRWGLLFGGASALTVPLVAAAVVARQRYHPAASPQPTLRSRPSQ